MACAIFGDILASVLGSWLNLAQHEQLLLLGLREKIIPFPIIGGFVLFLVLGGMVSLLFRYYIIPIMKIAESTQLITLANPNHRVPEIGAQEVAHLARIINSSADAYQKLQQEVEDAIYNSRADLLEERNRFAVLMSELPIGVLACNLHGQILLYNKQAQALFQRSDNGRFTGRSTGNGLIGLGRSLFGVIPRTLITESIERLQLAVDAGESAPNMRFPLDLEDGRLLSISMAPVFSFHCEQHDECVECNRRRISGFVLTVSNKPSESDIKKADKQSGEENQPARDRLISSAAPRPVFYEFDLFNHRESHELGKESLRLLTYVAFDTETTGLEPSRGDEIIQLGAVRIVNGKIISGEIIDQLIDPKRSIPEASTAIHGITRGMVANQPTIEQLLPHFHSFADGAVLVAHNAAFDMRCLQIKESQAAVKFDNPVLDTLLLSTLIHPHQESHSLDEIAARLSLTNIGRHTALGDAIVTAEVLLKMIPLLEAKGIITLNDAILASKRSPYARINY
ncbi:MAG: exonuclease domain-containing protein [Desulfuromonadaceae bacterium]|nr:exonuclease domain-containing protein [Desulfuromonadaceae bacterium]